LIVILLRGAVDGLNVVIPYAEGAYYTNALVSITMPSMRPLDRTKHLGELVRQRSGLRLYPASGTRIDLPMFREESGVWRRPITLPDEPCGPIGRAVLDELVERGLAVRGPDLAVPLRLV
jgi:uncharacterized protein (DUF1501 family)